MRWSRVTTGLLVGVLWMPSSAGARKDGQPAPPPAPARAVTPHFIDTGVGRLGLQRVSTPFRTLGIDNTQFMDINRIKMFVTNTGSFAWDKFTGNAGLEFPIGTGKTAVFAAGLWLGATVSGQTRIVVSEYSDEYGPGAMVGGTFDPNWNTAVYKVYKLDRVYTDPAARDAALADYTAGAVIHGAPAVSVQSDGSLDILGDQMCWAVYNDANLINHNNRAGSTQPLGVEVQQTTFAFKRQGALGQSIFIKYKLINKGGNTLDNMYVSQWSDPDLGNATDDFVGCDTTRSLGFVYNSTANDGVYGTAVPSVGYDFFQGPRVGGNPLPMTSFNKYTNGTDPNTFTKTYNYMKGLNPDGSTVINPTNNQATRFVDSGDPVTGAGWLDTNPGDRRLMLSSGPFTMAPGDTQEVVAAIVIGDGTDFLSSISLMKFYDSFAQSAFEANFNLPPPPNSPVVTTTGRPASAYFSWDVSSENYNQPPYGWEGYVVYQGQSASGPWKRLATFDKKDNIKVVYDDDFDPTTGQVFPVPKALGSDNGLQYQFEVTQDAFAGGPLHVGTPYYFSVNAYSVALGQTPQVLESAFNAFTVIPQTPAGGTDWSSAGVSPVTHVGNSTDQVTPILVDPDKVITATYNVGWKPACGTCTNLVWYETRTVGAVTDTVINNWSNISGDTYYPVIDGIQTVVLSYPINTLGRVSYSDVGPNPPALQGVDFGVRFFGGGADYAADFQGSSIPSMSTNTHNVEMRFNGTQYAYRYLRTLDNAGNRIYYIQDYVPVPFQVWDTDANVHLNAAFLENAGPPPAANLDGQWDPNDSGDGGREIVWILDKPYFGDATPDSAYFKPPPTPNDPDLRDILNGQLDARYVLWSNRTSAGAVIDPGDKILFTTSIPSIVGDTYSFSTTAPNRNNVALAKDELSKVRAVPNPYFAHSQYELSQFSRVVKFTHLPAQCTIRIFTLAGTLVRTIQKNDAGTSQVVWDLLTSGGLPVGSGIYIYHVDGGSAGTTMGKVAIFMEKERLNNF